jgi:hypothetical protein
MTKLILLCTLLVSSVQGNYDDFEAPENFYFDEIEANQNWYDPEYV